MKTIALITFLSLASLTLLSQENSKEFTSISKESAREHSISLRSGFFVPYSDDNRDFIGNWALNNTLEYALKPSKDRPFSFIFSYGYLCGGDESNGYDSVIGSYESKWNLQLHTIAVGARYTKHYNSSDLFFNVAYYRQHKSTYKNSIYDPLLKKWEYYSGFLFSSGYEYLLKNAPVGLFARADLYIQEFLFYGTENFPDNNSAGELSLGIKIYFN